MKILRKAIENYLEVQPLARERKNKDRAIVNTLLPRFVMLQSIDKDTLVRFVQDYNSTDRAWRKVLEERPELRGSDYDDKDCLEEETIESLRET